MPGDDVPIGGWRAIMLVCPSCNAVLSAQIHPRDIAAEVAAQVREHLRAK